MSLGMMARANCLDRF